MTVLEFFMHLHHDIETLSYFANPRISHELRKSLWCGNKLKMDQQVMQELSMLHMFMTAKQLFSSQ